MPGCDRIPSCLISSLANIQDNRVGANNTEMLMSSFGRILISQLLVSRSSEPKVCWSYNLKTTAALNKAVAQIQHANNKLFKEDTKWSAYASVLDPKRT